MPNFQLKITKHDKKQKQKQQNNNKQCEETKQASESDSDMIEILETSDHEFKITMINRLKALIEK